MRKLIICLSIMALISFEGCEDLLDEHPKTFISSANFYKSAGDFDAALKGLYNEEFGLGYFALRKVYGDLFAEYIDEPEPMGGEQGYLWRNNPSVLAGSGSRFDGGGNWYVPYIIVNNVNLILDGLKNVDLGADVEGKIEGEAKLLRAFAYFSLVQEFGDIPLHIDAVRSIDATRASKSPQADIYDLIISDLIFAESNLPDNAPVVGRVYKLVAKALLARVYLTTAGFPLNRTADFALAKTKALEVINSGKFVLVNDYANVFHNVRIYTTESIWEAFWCVPVVEENPLHNVTAPTGSNTAFLMPTDTFINSFPAGDRRREWGIKNGYVNAQGHTIVIRTYFNKYINELFFENELSAAAAMTAFEYNIPHIRLAEMYLIAAEAENEINGPANAYQYINIIRNRARINKTDPTHVPDLSGLTKDEFRNAVLMEREWELHLEGTAWFDMKRTQTFSKVQVARGSDLAVPIGAYNNTWLIPLSELQNNNITQNPAYGGK